MATLPIHPRVEKRSGYTDLVDADGQTVAYLVAVKDARLICDAVNAHPELVARLARLLAEEHVG